MVWALAGDAAQAEKLAGDLDKRFPEATYIRFGSLPAVRGILAIRQGNMPEGIENLRAVFVARADLTFRPVHASDGAGLYQRPGVSRCTSGSGSCGGIPDHHGPRWVVWNFPIGALAHLGLGRAYAMQGDTAKARVAYQDFLTRGRTPMLIFPCWSRLREDYAALQ